jgi:hypothetical protein
MNKAIAKYLLSDFSSRYGYDVGYIENMADISPGAFYRYLLCTPLSSYRKEVPAKSILLAKVVATRHFDCGPCLQLAINMAREAGVADQTIHGALTGTRERLSDDEQLATQYATAVVEQNAIELVDLEKLIVARWSEAALTDFAVAIAFAAFYPILRRGLGHAHSCDPVIKELAAKIEKESSIAKGNMTSMAGAQ